MSETTQTHRKTAQQYDTVLVFGVFDGFHEGHQKFLQQAQRVAKKLIVVVAQDAMVHDLKKKWPQNSLSRRIAAIRDAKIADTIVAGDLVRHSWSSIRTYHPDVIALGYDQDELQHALEQYQSSSTTPFDIVVLDPHQPDTFKSSIIYGDKESRKSNLEKRVVAHQKEKQHRLSRGEYLADFVYGANDGIITTFAIVTGAVGATLSPGIVVILGVANLLADGFSMGASSYLSILSEKNFHRSLREEQDRDIEKNPDIAREEVRSIVHGWSVPRDVLEPLVQVFTRDTQRWRDFIMKHQLDIDKSEASKPFRHGLATFTAFVIAGVLPIFPYLFGVRPERQFLVSVLATIVTLFVVGSLQSLLTNRKWWLRSGLQMLIVGGVGAIISYGIGFLVKTVFGVVV